MDRLLGELRAARERADAAERKKAELAKLVERFTGNRIEAEELISRLDSIEKENEDLRSRLERGREGVERMIARIRFLERQG
ncbi:MAG: hypothetical protein R3304_06965 [Longimicrobiales bacterium]|nr:hypothetical protein [Longimicrobiales bacterium]